MQRLIFIFVIFLLVSCKSKKEEKIDNWMLTNKKVYTDKLNIFGLPDTTYTKIYTFENSSIKDSGQIFTINRYDDDRRLVLKSFFTIRKDSVPLLSSQTKYIYSGKFLNAVIDETSGILIKNEKYNYDTAGKLFKTSIIRIKNFDRIFENDGNEIFPKDSLLNQGYDTLSISYKYDADSKNLGGDFVDNRGNLIRRDVNIYSGTYPISTYNLGPKGDTIQHITYVQQGNKVTSQIDNNNFTVVTIMESGYPMGKLTIYKKNNSKIREEWTYYNGKLVEQKLYTNIITDVLNKKD